MDNYFNHISDSISVYFNYTEKPKQEDFLMHMHDLYELYFFFSGDCSFRVEGNEYKLQSGDILLLKKAESHYVHLNDNKPYIRMAINFNSDLFKSIPEYEVLLEPFENRENGQMNIYKANEFKSSDHLIYINNLVTNAEHKSLQTVANLIPLLYEINLIFNQKKLQKQSQINSFSYQIVYYLNCNFLKNISINDLCKEFNISKTHLCRTFKNITGTTINHYISNKRLIYANDLIKLGTQPTHAYLLSGYENYSVFYRAYKKRYNIAPSDVYKING